VLGLLARWRAGRTDQVRGGLVMWGIWLLTTGVLFSTMTVIPHTAYVASLAPPVAALTGAGIVMLWRWYCQDYLLGWAFPIVVAGQLVWAAYLWSGHGTFLPWVMPFTLVAAMAAIALLAVGRVPARMLGTLATAGAAAGIAAMLAAPAAWAGSVLDVNYAGSSFDASAGPSAAVQFGPRPGGHAPGGDSQAAGARARSGAASGHSTSAGTPTTGSHRQAASGAGSRPASETSGGGRPAGGHAVTPGAVAGQSASGGAVSATTTLNASQQRIYDYVSAHRDGAGYLMAAASPSIASSYILATGQEVMPMGGLGGTAPEPALSQVQQLVHSGQLRFFLLGATSPAPPPGSPPQQVARWVGQHCAKAPARVYAGGSQTLYQCSPSS
jgi:4-amino-4-deoxy-L-arabinose transferase-like glycosyltransferase